jgi:hypothetical protein
MKIETTTTYKYIAIDGQEFGDEKACLEYEASLPRHLRVCLEANYSTADLDKIGIWQLGYSTTTQRTEYEPPSFLREGGEIVYEDHHDHVLFTVQGSLSDAINYGCERDRWFRSSGRFIKHVPVAVLTTPSHDRSPANG